MKRIVSLFVVVFLSVAVAAISSYWATRSVTPLYYTNATLMIGRVMQDPGSRNDPMMNLRAVL